MPRDVRTRTWWKWTIIANLTGIAILLTGWATNSSTLIALGFAVLIVSLGVRITVQVSRQRRRH